VATPDPETLPAISTWYLVTNLPRPGSPQAADSPIAPADLAEVVRLYGLRNWVEQSYKQVKHEWGWADFMVRTDRAIRRHWQLVMCAFSFCWRAWFVPGEAASASDAGRGENRNRPGSGCSSGDMAGGAAASARLAGPVDVSLALLARVVERAPAAGAPGPAGRRRPRASAQPLSPLLTKYR